MGSGELFHQDSLSLIFPQSDLGCVGTSYDNRIRNLSYTPDQIQESGLPPTSKATLFAGSHNFYMGFSWLWLWESPRELNMA